MHQWPARQQIPNARSDYSSRYLFPDLSARKHKPGVLVTVGRATGSDRLVTCPKLTLIGAAFLYRV
jgi:hypothetical protein